MDTAVLGSKAKFALNGGFARVASRYGMGHRVGSLGIDTSKRPYITFDDGAATHNCVMFGTGDDIVQFFNATDLVFTGASEGVGLVKLTNIGLAVGASGAYYTMASAAVHGFEMYVDSASVHASNSVESMYCRCNMEGAAGVGGRARFHMYTVADLGGWANALKAYSEFGASGRVTGLGSACCIEMKLPSENLGSGGAYMPLEVELVYAGNAVVSAGALNGNHVAFSTYRFSGDTDGDFDDNGFFYTVTGLTAGAGHVLSANSQTLKVGIGTGTTRYLPLSTIENGVGIGASGSNVSFAQGSPLFQMYSTCSSVHASNSVEPFYVYCDMTGPAGVGGRARFHLYSNVALGGWANALKAYTQFGASGRVTGLGSALCAELALSNGTTSGTYAALEAELVSASGDSCGTSTSFLYMNCTDDGSCINGANGYLFELGAGITDTTGGIFEAESNNDSMSMTHVLKIKIAGTAYYIALNTAKTF